MSRTLLSTLFVLLFSISASAQSAQGWLDKVSNTYKKTTSYYIKFEVKTDENTKAEVGELFAVKEKFSLKVLDIHQMYDGKMLYTITKDDKEVTVSKPDADSDDFLTPTKVLYMYKNNYKATLGKTGTVDGRKVQYIKMTPSKASEYDHIMIAVDVENNTIKEYNEYLQNGEARSIVVKEYLENLIIPRALFKFEQSKYEKDGYIVTHL